VLCSLERHFAVTVGQREVGKRLLVSLEFEELLLLCLEKYTQSVDYVHLLQSIDSA